MAIQFVTDAGTLVTPGAYPDIQVLNTPSALATTGVLMLVGESTAGPHFSEEEKLSDNTFGPDQASEFTAKYGSGPLVDAFRGGVAAANDPQIQGSFSRVIAVKTNSSTTATGTLPAIGSGTYATVEAKSAGKAGNLITRTVTQKTAEVIPTTGSFVLAPPQQSTVVAFRANGAAQVSTTMATGALPTTTVSAVNALSGIAATGGTNRSLVTSVAGTVTVVQDSGFQMHITVSTAWANIPTAGDLMYIPTGSPLTTANEGSYVITAASATRIDAYKVLDAAGSGNARTAPSSESTIAIAATTDVQAFAPVVFSLEAGAVISGLGKSMEVAEFGSENFTDVAFEVDLTASPVATNVDWVSTAAVPYAIPSASEYAVTLTAARQTDSINESVDSSSGVVLTLGYEGTTGSAVIADGVLTITVVGGAGVSPAAITLTDYPTIGDLVTYLNSLTGFSAAALTTALSQFASTDLDPGTYGIGSTNGANVGRIKSDGARFAAKVNANLVLLLIDIDDGNPVGLPDVASLAFLTGGAKGGTTNAQIQAGLDALKGCRGNFVVTLFSQDASVDIDNSLTDASSTYDIASINAALKSHCLQMAQLKERRPRQGFASFRGSFEDTKDAAGNLASSRVSLIFQDVKDTNSAGTIVQFSPWMGAVKAAAMQAAGFYRPIINKFINCSGVVHQDFNDQLNSDIEDALLSGLLPITQDEAGGFRWVSDQTTYTKDTNFVYNSIGAVYRTDVVASTTAIRMERAFVGQSIADVPASLALTTLEGIMFDMKRIKLIAPSDTAPDGFKNAKIRITGNAMLTSVTIVDSSAIMFIPISFLVIQSEQSAG